MKKGFTLVELVIVMVIIGILAGVAVPKYVNLVDQAKKAACLGALGGLRSGLSLQYAESVANGTTGTDAWPAGTDFMAQPVKNPYNDKDSISTSGTSDRGTDNLTGWAYYREGGLIYANSSSGKGENEW